MPPSSFSGPRLPKTLLDRIGDGQAPNHKRRRRAAFRKDDRSDERTRSKPPHKKPTYRMEKQPPAKGKRADTGGWGRTVSDITAEDDSVSEGDFDTDPDEELDERPVKRAKRTPSPPPPAGKANGVKKDKRLETDDAEIAALEKKLGIKSGKVPKSFADDGLDDLLGGLGAGETRKTKDEGRAWLESKRRKAKAASNEAEIDSGSDEDDLLDSLLDSMGEEEDDGLDALLNGDDDDDVSGDDDDNENDDSDENATEDEAFGGFDEDEDEDDEEHNGRDGTDDEDQRAAPTKQRENPYVAPGADPKPSGKYVPPSLRGPPSSDAEAQARLRRQTQGLLNKLSEANIISIVSEVEALYRSNARQYVTSTLIDLLLGLVSDPTALNDTFIILHAGFIAAVYKVIGSDFGAQFLERAVQSFDQEHEKLSKDAASTNKAPVNLMSLFMQLYNLQMISCTLIFDYIRLFLETLSESNTELLLRVVRLSGSQLRHDDPSTLKDIVMLLQKTTAKIGESNLSVRTKFMIQTINDLKNNKMRTGAAASALTAEHCQKMKRAIGTLNQRNIKATEPLRISLADIRDTSKKGKWWLVGASWKGNDTSADKSLPRATEQEEELDLEGEVSLDALAKSQGMNNPVRRAIFIGIMSAVDVADAQARIARLNLKRKQESEIPHVLLHCAGAEAAYNPYYTVLARKYCAQGPKLQRKFEFALWDLCKRMGERRHDDEDYSSADDDDDRDERRLSMPSLVSLAKLYADLLGHEVLPITVLRVLDLLRLKAQAKMFVEVLLISLILACAKKGAPAGRLAELFAPALERPQLAAGLQYFVEKYIARTDLAADAKEKKKLRRACRELVPLLQVGEAVGDDGFGSDDDED